MRFIKTYWPCLCTLLFWALVILLCASCTTVRYYPLENSTVVRDSVIIRDSVRITDSVMYRDSIIIRDSVIVTIDSSGNVVGKEKYQTTEYHNTKDSQTVEKQSAEKQTMNENKEVSKTEVTKTSWLDWVEKNIFYEVLAMIAVVLLCLYLKLSRNKDK